MMTGNPKSKKTVGLYVPVEYPFKGKQVKDELDKYFQWLWDNHRGVVESYPNIEIIKRITGEW